MAINDDAVVELVVNAIGYGAMMVLEDRNRLIGKASSAGPADTLADILKSDAVEFVRTRADLVEALDQQ